MASTVLKAGRSWTNRVRVSDEVPTLDVKNNPIHAAITGRMIRDINNGDYENMANLQISSGLVSINSNADKPVVIGYEELTVVADGKTEHTVSDPARLDVYLKQGMKIIRTERKEILG